MLVLLLEDNPADVKMFSRALKGSKFDLRTTAYLSSTLMALRNGPVGVVVLDLSVVDSVGVDTLVSVRREAPGVPVIVMSGHEDIDLARKCLHVGASSFLLKREFTSEELERELVYAIERNKQFSATRRILNQSLAAACKGKPVLAPQLVAIERARDATTLFLLKNYPGALDGLQQIEAQHCLHTAMHELRCLVVEPGPATEATYLGAELEDHQEIFREVVGRFLKASRNQTRLHILLIVCGLVMGTLLGMLL